jgi:CRISPR-associated protein Csx16
MTTWFVSRHPGAVEWAAQQGLQVDKLVAHLDITLIQQNDVVIGTLPVNLAAEVCARGADFHYLVITIPEELRGQELSCNLMEQLDARIQRYFVITQ